MHDSLFFIDGAPLCQKGHIVRAFNTEDLDPAMGHYYVHAGSIYCSASESVMYEDQKRPYVTETRRLLPFIVDGVIEISAVCPDCRQVYTDNYSLLWGGPLRGRAPWMCLELHFLGGQLMKIDQLISQAESDVLNRYLASSIAEG